MTQKISFVDIENMLRKKDSSDFCYMCQLNGIIKEATHFPYYPKEHRIIPLCCSHIDNYTKFNRTNFWDYIDKHFSKKFGGNKNGRRKKNNK